MMTVIEFQNRIPECYFLYQGDLTSTMATAGQLLFIVLPDAKSHLEC